MRIERNYIVKSKLALFSLAEIVLHGLLLLSMKAFLEMNYHNVWSEILVMILIFYGMLPISTVITGIFVVFRLKTRESYWWGMGITMLCSLMTLIVVFEMYDTTDLSFIDYLRCIILYFILLLLTYAIALLMRYLIGQKITQHKKKLEHVAKQSQLKKFLQIVSMMHFLIFVYSFVVIVILGAGDVAILSIITSLKFLVLPVCYMIIGNLSYHMLTSVKELGSGLLGTIGLCMILLVIHVLIWYETDHPFRNSYIMLTMIYIGIAIASDVIAFMVKHLKQMYRDHREREPNC